MLRLGIYVFIKNQILLNRKGSLFQGFRALPNLPFLYLQDYSAQTCISVTDKDTVVTVLVLVFYLTRFEPIPDPTILTF
jgi:hypothetical protein